MDRDLRYVSESQAIEVRGSNVLLRRLVNLNGFSLFGLMLVFVSLSFLNVNSEALGFEMSSGYVWVLMLLMFGFSVLVSGFVSLVVWLFMFIVGARESRLSYVDVLRFSIVVASVLNLSSYVFWFGLVDLDFWYRFYIGLTTLVLLFVVWTWNIHLMGIRYIERCEASGYILSDEEYAKRFGGDVKDSAAISDSNSALSDELDGRSEAEKRGYDVDENGFILPTARNRELGNQDRRKGGNSDVE